MLRSITSSLSSEGLNRCSKRIPCYTRRILSVVRIIEDRVAQGDLQIDPVQKRAAKRLDRLLRALETYSNQSFVDAWCQHQVALAEEKKRILEEQKGIEEDGTTPLHENVVKEPIAQSTEPTQTDARVEPPPIPRGLFIYGPVGTGKSMLMDIFFEIYEKGQIGGQRVHFHSFMNDIQKRIHAARQRKRTIAAGTNGDRETVILNQIGEYLTNPVQQVGVQLASETPLLCLDEFQVTDVANAYILTQLLEVLFSLGTVVVATSNQPPQDLSSSYVGSDDVFFASFVELLKRHCIIHKLDSDIDYRILPSLDEKDNFFLDSSQESTETRFEDLAEELLLDYSTNPDQEVVLELGFDRRLSVRGDGVGRFGFDELCREQYFGTLEFRAIARHYPIMVLSDIPVLHLLNLRDVDPARRFVTLLDELYEARVAVLCSAAAPTSGLFSSMPSGGEYEKSASSPAEWTLDSDQLIGEVERVKLDKPHAYQRAASRLTEMTSRKWWNRVLRKNR